MQRAPCLVSRGLFACILDITGFETTPSLDRRHPSLRLLRVDRPPQPPQVPPVEPLSKSEMAVLRLAAQGVDNQEIAQALNYSVYTVANRLRTIYEKLHVTNRTQAALYALRQGWTRLDEPPS